MFANVNLSNHLHLVVRAKQGNLSDIVRDFKKYTSGALIRMLSHPEKAEGTGWFRCLKKEGNDRRKSCGISHGSTTTTRKKSIPAVSRASRSTTSTRTP